jgi:hypothetical protein
MHVDDALLSRRPVGGFRPEPGPRAGNIQILTIIIGHRST